MIRLLAIRLGKFMAENKLNHSTSPLLLNILDIINNSSYYPYTY